MENIDNINYTLAEDLKKTVTKGSKVSIASACFSIYAFEELKKELKGVESLRFIFTSPTFLEDKAPREKKEFYIPRLSRERSVYGTEFEVKLRNGLTQKALARECANWVRTRCEFRSNVSYRPMDSMLNVESGDSRTSYRPVSEFTTVGIGSDNAYIPVDTFVGRRFQPVADEFDEEMLRTIAGNSGGQYFHANDADGMKRVMDEINQLETTSFEQPKFIEYREIAPDLALLAVALLACGFLAESTWKLQLP